MIITSIVTARLIQTELRNRQLRKKLEKYEMAEVFPINPCDLPSQRTTDYDDDQELEEECPRCGAGVLSDQVCDDCGWGLDDYEDDPENDPDQEEED